jgi:uncharacterized membrane protein YcaP (DUF421 family)
VPSRRRSWQGKESTTQSLIDQVFGGNTPQFPLTAYQVAARACIVYVAAVIIVRAGKSRLLSRATSLDVMLGFILGSLLSRGMTGHSALSDTFIAAIAIVAIHWLLTAAAFRSVRFETLIKGHVTTLVKHGQLVPQSMRRAHISQDDLQEALRLNGIDDLSQVKLANKERNGEVSVIKVASRSKGLLRASDARTSDLAADPAQP